MLLGKYTLLCPICANVLGLAPCLQALRERVLRVVSNT